MDFLEEREKEDIEFEQCINAVPGEFKQASFTMLPNSMHRNVPWQKWRGSPKASTVWWLVGYIIRAKIGNPIADRIYEKYYKKRHLLVARYTQQSIAEIFGYRDRRAVNNHLMACKNEGIFRVEELPWGNRKIKIYIFGSWENKTGCNYIETFDMFNKFKKLDGNRKLAKKFTK